METEKISFSEADEIAKGQEKETDQELQPKEIIKEMYEIIQELAKDPNTNQVKLRGLEMAVRKLEESL